uniref:E3 ubiquitin-protein ligase RNF13-like n=1 Tax=Hirondellea gigas TaxID=1518452 RepID=A0A2P2HXG3_9CRUS
MAANTNTITRVALLLGFLCLSAWPSAADVFVIDRIGNKTVDIMADMPSVFGPQLSSSGMKGLLHISWPIHACGRVHRPPPLPEDVHQSYARWIALVQRNNCTYAAKVANAQAAGYSAVIVMNIGSNFIEPMSAADSDAENITIPSVFIGQSDGDTLDLFFKDYNRYGLILTGDLPFNIQSYLLPFAITVVICFVGMLICMIVKCIRDYRRSLRHRLSWRSLRRLPIHKFRAGDPYEVCAICLDDYLEGDKLRILPCNHGYHSRCIDPWLTKRRRVCPVCKQKVRVGGETAADDTDDDDTDTDRGTNERAPLLQQATRVSAGTFTNNRENPFQRASRHGEERRQRTRSGYGRLEDSIENASDLSDDDSDRRTQQQQSDPQQHDYSNNGHNIAQGSVSSSVAAAAAAMLPGDEEEDHVDQDLDVVTITRTVKKKNKKKRSRKDSSNRRSISSTGGGAEDADDEAAAALVAADYVVQIDPHANNEPAAEKREIVSKEPDQLV